MCVCARARVCVCLCVCVLGSSGHHFSSTHTDNGGTTDTIAGLSQPIFFGIIGAVVVVVLIFLIILIAVIVIV